MIIKRFCRHCKKECFGHICRECFKKNKTGCVSRRINGRKKKMIKKKF